MSPNRTAYCRIAFWFITALAIPWASASARICNQSTQAICDQRFDAAAYATTHNSFSVTEEGFLAANQHYGLTRQLEDGVRAFMLDVYDFSDPANGLDPDVYLCHGYCWLGARPLTDALVDIRTFLEGHPDEVLSIIFESYVPIDELVARFTASGLDPYLHVQAAGQPWPTLNQMIDSGRRLVVFSDRVDAPRPGYHYVWSFAVETPFSARTPEDLSCNRNRGSDANPLFIFNHFLTRNSGSPELASQVNYDPFFISRAIDCWSARNHLPNFVTVDYYDIGDVLPVVDELNRNRLLSATPPPTYTPTPTPTPFVCASAPEEGCTTGDRAKLKIAHATTRPNIKLQWKAGIESTDLGRLDEETDSALCLYIDGLSVLQLNLPAGSNWAITERDSVLRRATYKSTDGSPDGVTKASITVGDALHGKLKVIAKGDLIVLPAGIVGATPATTLTAQFIVRDGSKCWSANFNGESVK